jgi:hypothetical protein
MKTKAGSGEGTGEQGNGYRAVPPAWAGGAARVLRLSLRFLGGVCRMKLVVLMLCAAAAFCQAAHADAGPASGGVKVDGFKIKIRSSPTKAKLAHPTSTTGTVRVVKGYAHGCTDPFRDDAGLSGHSKYVCVDGKSTATFVAPQPAIRFQLLWGSPDTDNTLSVYDTSGTLIDAISGKTLDKKLQISNSHDYVLRIESKTPIGSISLTSVTCCFEIDNLKFKPVP